jgi:hypothetical protein
MLSRKRKDIIKRVRGKLKELGKTENWMVKSSGVLSSKWARFKQDNRFNLSQDEFMKISFTLGLDANYLYHGDGHQKSLYENLNNKISTQERQIQTLKEQLKEYNSIKSIISGKKKK